MLADRTFGDRTGCGRISTRVAGSRAIPAPSELVEIVYDMAPGAELFFATGGGLGPRWPRTSSSSTSRPSAADGRWWMHRLSREFGRRTGVEAELTAAREIFVKGCAEFALPFVR